MRVRVAGTPSRGAVKVTRSSSSNITRRGAHASKSPGDGLGELSSRRAAREERATRERLENEELERRRREFEGQRAARLEEERRLAEEHRKRHGK